MAAADTLRQLLDAGKSSKRLDELSSARVIGKVALQVHAAQQKAGAGKAVGPITPTAITFAPSGEVTFSPADTSSLGYSAPEQLTGGGDRKSDVFSLGTVLWEVLTYQRLFDAMSDAAVRAAVQERDITPPTELNANVPAELSAICMRALARNPSDRYQSLKAMAVEIEEFLSEAGYDDNDERIAQYLKAMPRTSPGVALASKLASAASSGTAVGVPAAPAPTPAAAPAPVPAPAELVPMAPVLPSASTSIRNDKSTISVSVPPQVKVATNGAAVVEAKHEPSKPHALIVEDKPKAVIVDDKVSTSPGLGQTIREPAKPAEKIETNGTPTVELKKPLEAPPVVAPVVKVEAKADVRDTLPDAKADVRDTQPDAKVEEKKPDDKKATKRTGPHPVAAVSLGPAPRESKGDVLAGWGWGTDKHEALAPEGYAHDDEDFHAPPDNKKTLMYVIGGGVAVAALVTIIALVAGGSSPKKKSNRPVAAAQTADAQQAATEPTPTPLPATDTGSAGSAVDPAATNTAATDQAASDQAAAQKAADDKAAAEKAAADQAAAEKATAEQTAADKKAAEKLAAEQAAADKKAAADKALLDKKAAEQAAADKKAADKAAAAQALADKRAAEKAAAEQKAADKKAAADKLAADRKAAQEKAAADKKAAAEKLAAERAAKQNTRPTTTTTAKTNTKVATADTKMTPKVDTKTTAKTDTKNTAKVDVESAYRQGLQQFARGDTAGALASLRTSLAANPNYAPTWRGLGLVFEKMGETQQARAAYKRYLQLAPGANDSEQIKGRLERLGS
ncbi:MAG TPA: protein kinase [Kofleriaceae bacterium]|nr:protein kinase [Kofleriaceae bacterium]